MFQKIEFDEKILARDKAGNILVADMRNKMGVRNKKGELVTTPDLNRFMKKAEVKEQLRKQGFKIPKFKI